MRHRVHGRKLGRTSAHRKALFRNQLTALFTHDRIITTVAKAKELRPIAERMVTIARTGTLAARRKVGTMVPDNDVARRLFEEIAPRFADRPGGYTRIMRLGRRHGDNAELAIIEFVDYELADHTESGADGDKESFMDRAKGVFGGGAKADATDASDETTQDEAEETPLEAEAATEEPEEAAAPAEVEEPAPVEEVTEEVAAEVDEEPQAEAEVAEVAEETAAEDEEKPKS